MTAMATEAPGLRALKRIRTRQAIAAAAFELFLAHGYDNVTVVQVAEQAEVSVATLFNYVPDGKEALIFDDGTERRDGLVAAVRDRPAGQTVLDAIHGFLAGRGPFAADLPPDRARRRDLIRATPALRGYQRTLWMRAAGALADVVATETGRDAGDPVVRALTRYVLEIPDIIGLDPSPRAALDAIFGLLRDGFPTPESLGRTKPADCRPGTVPAGRRRTPGARRRSQHCLQQLGQIGIDVVGDR
jgi:AcrR family transcriptional regulator